DAGVRQFTVTLRTLGNQTITVRDTATGSLVGSATVSVISRSLFYPAVHYGSGTRPTGVVAGDWDEDGILDLISVNQGSNSVSLLLGTGDGRFRLAGQYNAGSGANLGAAGDVNADGHLDLVVANWYANTVSVFLGDGSGGLRLVGDFASGQGP